MSGKFGPTRGEHLFRPIFSLAALPLLGLAIWTHGLQGPAMVEIGLFGGGFLIGSAAWSAWNLWKGKP